MLSAICSSEQEGKKWTPFTPSWWAHSTTYCRKSQQTSQKQNQNKGKENAQLEIPFLFCSSMLFFMIFSPQIWKKKKIYPQKRKQQLPKYKAPNENKKVTQKRKTPMIKNPFWVFAPLSFIIIDTNENQSTIRKNKKHQRKPTNSETKVCHQLNQNQLKCPENKNTESQSWTKMNYEENKTKRRNPYKNREITKIKGKGQLDQNQTSTQMTKIKVIKNPFGIF